MTWTSPIQERRNTAQAGGLHPRRGYGPYEGQETARDGRSPEGVVHPGSCRPDPIISHHP